LSAATAVVAGGIVGVVWAGMPSGVTGETGELKAVFRVNQVTELEAIGKNLTEENLSFVVDAVPTAVNFGNLGTIRVKTSSTSWDVLMTTANGGRMLDETSGGCTEVPTYDGWGNVNGTQPSCPDPKRYLQYDKSTTSGTVTYGDVVLDVAIGIAKSGKAVGNTGAPESLFPLISSAIGAAPVFIAPVKITGTKIPNSEKGIGTSFAPVSFATELGKAATAPTGPFANGIWGNTTVGVDAWTTIGSDGFPAPKGNYEPQEEYFYVNVGMDPTSVYQKLGNNENKKNYTETFYFELVANF